MEIGRATSPGAGAVRPYYLILAGSTLAVVWQFVFPGIYQGASDDAAIMFKYVPQFAESYRQGILYPRWMPDDFSRYGSPAFVYYSPLLYIVSGIMSLTGLDIVLIKSVLELVRLYIGGVFIFLLVRDIRGRGAGLTAALFYTLLPARIADLYYLASPATRFAQAFMPMALYFTRMRVTRPNSRLYFPAMACSYAAIVLSHLATAYLFTPFLLAYGFFAAEGKTGARGLLKSAAGTGAGLLLCSFFFIPVLFERGLVRMEFMGRFNYRDFFLFTAGKSFPGELAHLRPLIFNPVAAETCLLAIALYFAWRYRVLRLDREVWFYLAASIACLFMMSPISGPLWDHAPGLKTVQFPFRFEPINLLFVSSLLGMCAPPLIQGGRRHMAVTAFILALSVGLLAYDARLVTASTPYSAGDVAGTARSMRFPEYLPRTAPVEATDGFLREDDPLLSSADEFTCSVARWGYIDRLFTIDSPRGVRLHVKTFYFPGWRALVDGKEVPLTAQEKTGAILMDVPPGRHEVALRFTDTPPRTAGKIISLLTLIALVLTFRKTPLSFAKESRGPHRLPRVVHEVSAGRSKETLPKKL